MHAGRSLAMATEADRDGWAVLTVRSDGVIEASSELSLSPTFSSGQRVPAAVADLLLSQVAGGPEPTSHDVTAEGERWRCVVHPGDVGPTVLLVRRLGDESEEAAQLRDVGLTPRQTDVALELARTGGTNAQLAGSLGMSAGTVKKHLEAIFRVLGVDSRSAAVVSLRSLQGNESSF
jgi:DNA-binding CsgD family transcriptional regulator